MNYNIEEISGSSYIVRLLPVSEIEQHILEENETPEFTSEYYRKAVESTLGRLAHIASLTPNADFPYSATIECLSESGSV